MKAFRFLNCLILLSVECCSLAAVSAVPENPLCNRVFALLAKFPRDLRPRISQPVFGFFDSIPSDLSTLNSQKWTFKQEALANDSIRTTSIHHTPFGDLEGTTLVEVKEIMGGKNNVIFHAAFFDITGVPDKNGKIVKMPSKIEHNSLVPLIKSTNEVPVAVLMFLSSLKKAKVSYGGISSLKLPRVMNLESMIELAGLEKAWRKEYANSAVTEEIRSELFRHTSIYKFVETAITQSGHIVNSLKIAGGNKLELPRRFDGSPLDKLADIYGLETGDPYLVNYEVNIGLSPLDQ